MAAAQRRAAGRKLRVCHGGTLDPFASGLLLILVEPATRLFDYLHEIPKVYEATVKWGSETDNGDPFGRVVSSGDASNISVQQLEAILAGFVGWHEQVPHATSAKRVGGERAYLKAHRGEEVEMPATKVYLHQAIWLEHDLPKQSRLRLVVRGGYYVRALVRDIGRSVGCFAHVSDLHRVSIGPWNDPGDGHTELIQGRGILPWFPSRNLSDEEVGELRANREIEMGQIIAPEWPLPAAFPEPSLCVRGFVKDRFSFILKLNEEKLRLEQILPGGL